MIGFAFFAFSVFGFAVCVAVLYGDYRFIKSVEGLPESTRYDSGYHMFMAFSGFLVVLPIMGLVMFGVYAAMYLLGWR